MPKLVATKPFAISAQRRYAPGDEFDVRTTGEARALKALGRARDFMPPAHPAPDPDRDVLRQQAEALGIEVDGRWGSQRLRDEIADAQQRRQAEAERTAAERTVPRRYFRRDMQAEDTE